MFPNPAFNPAFMGMGMGAMTPADFAALQHATASFGGPFMSPAGFVPPGFMFPPSFPQFPGHMNPHAAFGLSPNFGSFEASSDASNSVHVSVGTNHDEAKHSNGLANTTAAIRGARSKRHQSTFDVAPFPHELITRESLHPETEDPLPDDLAGLTLDDLHDAARASESASTTVYANPAPSNVTLEQLNTGVVIRVGVCKTRNAGTWVWTVFRGSVWVVPPPFKYLEDGPDLRPLPTPPAPHLNGAASAQSTPEATDAPGPLDTPPDRIPRSPHEHRHFTVYHPPQAPESIRLILVHYKCFTCMGPDGDYHNHPDAPLPGPSTAQRTAAKHTLNAAQRVARRPADVKLGGMCCDLPWQAVAHVVSTVTGIRVRMVEVFAASQSGRCCLWLEDPAETDLLLRRLVGRLWMAPASHGYAVLAADREAKLWLQGYLAYLRRAGITRVPFPRHLLTAERWRLGAAKAVQSAPTPSASALTLAPAHASVDGGTL
jgi:hypothetical protein